MEQVLKTRFKVDFLEVLIKVIGIWCFLHGLYLGFAFILTIWASNIFEVTFQILRLFIAIISIIGGISFIQYKSKLSWSLVVGKLAFMVIMQIRANLYFLLLLIERNKNKEHILGLINVFDEFPLIGLRNHLLIISILLLVYGLLHNNKIIKMYEVNIRRVGLTTIIGVTVSVIMILIENYVL